MSSGILFSVEQITAASVKTAKQEIALDIRRGRVPATVRDFGELHDHVDANEYGGMELLFNLAGSDLATDILNAAQDRVDEWLRAGRPEDRSDDDAEAAEA